MTITAEQVFLLNRMGSIARKVQLGTLIQNAEAIVAGEITVADGQILIGTVANVGAAKALSGAITITREGVATLGADAVTGADKIADDAVSLEHLDAGITPGLMVVAAGLFTTAGGDANESITAATVLGTDTVLAWVQKDGAVPRTVDTITPGAGSIALVMSGDPSTDHLIAWTAYRAPA